MEIKRLYELKDAFDRRLHSQMEIARMLGVSETTVFRTIHKRGAYEGIRDLPTDQEAAESQARFLAANSHLLDQGGSALEKLQSAIAEVKARPAKVNGMLDELSEEGQERLRGYL
jgi:DNA-binding MurR/RpiR family transcriptional regulator